MISAGETVGITGYYCGREYAAGFSIPLCWLDHKERKLSGTFWLLRFSDRLVVITGISLLYEGRVRARRYAMENNQETAPPERLADRDAVLQAAQVESLSEIVAKEQRIQLGGSSERSLPAVRDPHSSSQSMRPQPELSEMSLPEHRGSSAFQFPDNSQSASLEFNNYFAENSVSTESLSENPEAAPLPELLITGRKFKAGKEHFTPHREHAISAEGQRLLLLAANRIPETKHPSVSKELIDFRNNVEAFETRAHSSGIGSSEIAATYDAVAKLLEERGDGFMKERQRIRVAEQIIRNVADPTNVDQGTNVTCTQQTIENRLYTLAPSVAANLISTVAVTGRFTATDGTQVSIPKTNVLANGPEAQNDPQNGERVLASQIFQVTSANLYYTWRRNQGHPDGDYRYEHFDGKEHLFLDPKDPSKYDPSQIGEQKPLSDIGPAATSNAMVHTYKLLTGKDISDSIFVNNENRYESDNDVAGFSTAREMQEALLRLKKEGKLPAIVSVHSHRAEIREAGTKNATIGGSPFDDGHVALVTDIVEGKDGEATKVMLDNQWGKPSDRLGAQALTLDQAFNATRSLSGIEYMKYMEDWMRQTKIEGKYSSRKLYSKLISFAEGAVGHWQVQSKVNPELAAQDKEVTFAAFEKMREKLPTRERNRLPSELPAEFRRLLLGEAAANAIVPMRPEPTPRHRLK